MAKTLQKITVSSAQGPISLYSWLYGNLFEPWAGAYNGSLFFALAYVLFWLGSYPFSIEKRFSSRSDVSVPKNAIEGNFQLFGPCAVLIFGAEFRKFPGV
jgi:hypothetical protein